MHFYSKNRNRKLQISISVGILILFFISTWSATPLTARGDGVQIPPKPESQYPRIETNLEIMSKEAARGNVSAARSQARAMNLDLSRGNFVEVIIELEKGGENIESKLGEVNGEMIARTDNLAKVNLPISNVIRLPEIVDGINYVRPPHKPVPLGFEYGRYFTKGVNLTGGGLFHTKNIHGQGTSVAVIDVGFSSYNYAREANEFPDGIVVDRTDYTGTGFLNGGPHGTAVAEIVHDMAPSAELYLKRIDDEVSLGQAIQDAIAQDVDIIVHSVGWVNTNFGDGTGVIANEVKKATDHGILWVNAAGNSALRHWEGSARDTDGDGWVEFESGKEMLTVEVNYSSTIQAFLTWNDWPTSFKDFDLFLYDGKGRLLSSSRNQQTGNQPPAERLSEIASPGGTYLLKVSVPDNYSGTQLEIFSFNHRLDPYVERSSVMAPGNVEAVFTVGAIDKNNWKDGPIEYFSSRGPTYDGRVKPDITGVDGVAPFAWYGKFYGTSAAAPYVAGAAGLVLSRSPDMTAEEIKEALVTNAQDLGKKGIDNTYGAGKMQLIYKKPSATRSIEVKDGEGIEPGDQLTVKITASMPTTLQGGLKLEEEVPDEFEVLNVNQPSSSSVTGHKITGSWSIVPPGEERELVYSVLVPEGTPTGNYDFSGFINGNSVSGTATATVQSFSESGTGEKDVEIEKVDISVDRVMDLMEIEAVGENITEVKVVVYSTAGKEVFDSGWVEGVDYQWGYHDQNGDTVPNGIYILHVQVKGENGDIESSGLEKALVLR